MALNRDRHDLENSNTVQKLSTRCIKKTELFNTTFPNPYGRMVYQICCVVFPNSVQMEHYGILHHFYEFYSDAY